MERITTLEDVFDERFMTVRERSNEKSLHKIFILFRNEFDGYIRETVNDESNMYTFKDDTGISSRQALSIVYSRFHRFGFRRLGWCSEAIRREWERLRPIMVSNFGFVREAIMYYSRKEIRESSHAVQEVTNCDNIVGGKSNEVITHRPFLPQAASKIIGNILPTKDGIRMIAFLSIVHLGKIPINYWINVPLNRRTYIEPSGNRKILLHPNGRKYFVEITLQKGSEEFAAFEHFFNIRIGRRPLHWRPDTLFGFQNKDELMNQFAYVQKKACFPVGSFTLRSFKNGAIVVSVCQDLLDGFSKEKAISNLVCRPGYKEKYPFVDRLLGDLPSLIQANTNSYTKFSQFPLSGMGGVYKEFRSIDFMDGPVYEPKHTIMCLLDDIRPDLRKIHSAMGIGAASIDCLDSRNVVSSEDLLEDVSNKLFSAIFTLSNLNDIADKINRCNDNDMCETERFITFFLVSGGFLRSSNWKNFNCPRCVYQSLSNIQRKTKHQPERIPFTYTIADNKHTKERNTELEAHNKLKRKCVGPFPSVKYKKKRKIGRR